MPSRRRPFASSRDVAQQVGVRQVTRLAGRLADPVVGDLVAPARLDVPVEAVPGDVQLAVGEPGAVRRIPLEALRRLAGPADELVCEAHPESLGVALRLLVDGVVADERAAPELVGRRERRAAR